MQASRDAGATDVAIGATRTGVATVEDHLAVLSTVADALALNRPEVVRMPPANR